MQEISYEKAANGEYVFHNLKPGARLDVSDEAVETIDAMIAEGNFYPFELVRVGYTHTKSAGGEETLYHYEVVDTYSE